MDLDPSVEPELDSFSLFLPLPFRVSLIIVLGMRRHTKIPGENRELIVTRSMGLGRQSALSTPGQDCSYFRIKRAPLASANCGGRRMYQL